MYKTHRTEGSVVPVAVRHVSPKIPVAARGGGRATWAGDNSTSDSRAFTTVERAMEPQPSEEGYPARRERGCPPAGDA